MFTHLIPLYLYKIFIMNRFLKTLLIICSLIIVEKSFAQKKINYGVGLEFSYNHLTGVIAEELTPYGHSGKQSNQRSSETLSPHIFAQKNIFNAQWAVHLGLGYSGYHHYFDFNDKHPLDGVSNTTLKISWHYLQIPIALSYDLSLNAQKSIIFQAGPRVNILLHGKDNYLDIIHADTYVSYSRIPLNMYVFGSIGYQQQLSNKGVVQIKPFVNYELNAQHMLGWGFFQNLEKAKNLQIGLGMSYLF